MVPIQGRRWLSKRASLSYCSEGLVTLATRGGELGGDADLSSTILVHVLEHKFSCMLNWVGPRVPGEPRVRGAVTVDIAILLSRHVFTF